VAGTYIAEKKPDVIVCIGDFGDFPSLSCSAAASATSTTTVDGKDLAAFHEGMQLFMAPIDASARSEDPPWKPFIEFTEGNHESHLDRITQQYPFLEGTIDKTTCAWRSTAGASIRSCSRSPSAASRSATTSRAA
jgi:hypothetical protein